ncbi:MAG: hypothetical protein MUD01_11835 [Chloroflexaceae bacterium]|jgi:hypothetical protein|nr:hypothetical protein [Chloroflexaceae bacterium]
MGQVLPLRPLLSLLLLVVLLAGCVSEPQTPPAAMEFVPTDGAYAAYTGETFGMNLMFLHLRTENISTDNITRVELLPDSNLVQVNGFRVFARGLGNVQVRRGLTLDVTAVAPGEHTFTEARLITAEKSYTAPLGQLKVEVRQGELSRAQVLFQSRGEIVQPGPGSLTIANPSDTPLRIKQLTPMHPRIALPEGSITVSDGSSEQPFPAGGLELAPNARLTFTLNWKLDQPTDRAFNIDWRPLLVLERNGVEEYVGMINIIFRTEQVNAPLN